MEIENYKFGILQEMKDKFLQPFFITMKGTQVADLGRGVSITNNIIKAPGVSLEIERASGQGTNLKIVLIG